MVFVLFYPKAFIAALDWGGLFVAILLGIWPVLMVHKRRKMKLHTTYVVPGGKWTLFLTMLAYVFVVFLEGFGA